MQRLAGKVVAITGASSGIGRGIAERFASEGAAVVLGARTAGPLEALAATLKRGGARALAVPMDVRREEDIVRFVEAAVAAFGRLDVFVNNAGVGVWKRVEDTSLADFHAVLRTNLYGTFLGSREAFRHMRAHGGGTILNISSMAGKDAWEGTGVYSASKFGVQGLSRALSDEGRAHGVRVSCICPGMVDTPLIADQDVAKREELIAVRDVAEAAVYLATLPPNVMVQELLLERKLADS